MKTLGQQEPQSLTSKTHLMLPVRCASCRDETTVLALNNPGKVLPALLSPQTPSSEHLEPGVPPVCVCVYPAGTKSPQVAAGEYVLSITCLQTYADSQF